MKLILIGGCGELLDVRVFFVIVIIQRFVGEFTRFVVAVVPQTPLLARALPPNRCLALTIHIDSEQY